MRHPPAAIRQFLIEQQHSGQSIANFCFDNDLKVPTFYSWKRKHSEVETVKAEGFCKITPRPEISERGLRFPSGLELTIIGLSTTEIAEVILEIDRAYA